MRQIRVMFILMILCSIHAMYATQRFTMIEDFESGIVSLTSWQGEDVDPTAWALDEDTTYENSQYSLRLDGNTWKEQQITPLSISQSSVLSFAARVESGATIQGFGISDGTNQLFYSISGSRVADIEVWVPVYQGAYSANYWHEYLLPVGADWEAFFGYLPTVTSLIYINDLDTSYNRSIWIDKIMDISDDVPVAPMVSILYGSPTGRNNREVSLQFQALITDPDSDTFSYLWNFGDGGYSTEAAPMHTFTIADAHSYTVSLSVVDVAGKMGFAATQVMVDEGPSNLPLTLNFVGDVMLARRYEYSGGIIPTMGVNAIFAPTLAMYGMGADVSVANLEVVLANTGSPHPTKSVVYRGNPDNVTGLSFAGIDVVSLANNHTLDYGLPALQQTQDLLDTQGILYSGGGADSYEAYTPTFVNRKGLNLAFLRSSDRTGQYNNAQPYLQAGYDKPGFAYMTPYYIEQQIAAVDDVADLKIVEMHGGSEYSTAPGSGYDKFNPFLGDTQDEDYSHRTDVPHQWDIAIRHSAVDSGADLVIVHHPHIIQALEVYNGKVIAHSLGNFAFDLDYPECMHSMIFYADAYEDGFRNHRVRPVYIDNYIPKPAIGKLGLYTLDYLAMKSRELDTVLIVDKEDLSASVALDPNQLVSYPNHWSCTQNFVRYEDEYQYTDPIKLPRYGSISSIDNVSPTDTAEYSMGSELVWFGNFEDEGSNLWAVDEFSPDAIEGERSAFLTTADETVTNTISKKLKMYDNTKRYTLHGFIKTRSAGAANITIRFFSSRTSGYVIEEIDLCTDVSGSTPWTWYYKQLELPSNAYYYDIRLRLSSSSGFPAQAWFDNVGLIEWTPWQGSVELASIAFPNNYYWLQCRSSDSSKSISTYLTETSLCGAQSPQAAHSPVLISSLKVYPNPFNPDTNISFELSATAHTSLKIYNIKGQLVRKLLNQDMNRGSYHISWDGRDQSGKTTASGMYLFRLEHGGQSYTGKAVLMK